MADEAVLKTKRPFLVWVIAISLLCGALAIIVSEYLISSGILQIDPVQKAQLDSLKASQTVVDHISMWLISIIGLAGALMLFLMKKIAFPIFIAHEVLGWCNYVSLHISGQYSKSELISNMAFSEVLSLLILYYVWSLYKKGALG